MKGNVKIVCAVILTAILFTGGGVLLAKGLSGEFAGIEKEKLKSYEYSSGGNMIGSLYSQSILEYDEDSALVTIIQQKWRSDDGTVKEYLVDKEILNELKAVFVKYNMKNWDNKKFTDIVIPDGSSYGHRFKFETNSVSFSSQYYPEKYASKLKELDEILDKYLKNAIPLPGLLTPIANKDERQLYDFNNGKIVLSVYSYYQKCLYYRIVNGTDETKKTESVIRLYRDNESTPIYEKSSESKATIYAHDFNKDFIELNERLMPGKYRLEVFGYTTEFEIQ